MRDIILVSLGVFAGFIIGAMWNVKDHARADAWREMRQPKRLSQRPDIRLLSQWDPQA